MIVFDPRYLPDCRLKKSAVNQRLSSLLREERAFTAQAKLKRGAVFLAALMGAPALAKGYSQESAADLAAAKATHDLRFREAQYLSCLFTEIRCVATFRRTLPHLDGDQLAGVSKAMVGSGEKVHLRCLDMVWPYLKREGLLSDVFSV